MRLTRLNEYTKIPVITSVYTVQYYKNFVAIFTAIFPPCTNRVIVTDTLEKLAAKMILSNHNSFTLLLQLRMPNSLVFPNVFLLLPFHATSAFPRIIQNARSRFFDRSDARFFPVRKHPRDFCFLLFPCPSSFLSLYFPCLASRVARFLPPLGLPRSFALLFIIRHSIFPRALLNVAI